MVGLHPIAFSEDKLKGLCKLLQNTKQSVGNVTVKQQSYHRPQITRAKLSELERTRPSPVFIPRQPGLERP